MSTLILKLSTPLQSWGGYSVGMSRIHRPTYAYPTKSGLTGLLAACCGVTRENFAGLEEIHSQLEYSAWRRPQERRSTQLLIDYQIVRRTHRKQNDEKNILTYRHYLQDTEFLVAIEHPNAEEYAEAVQRPVYQPYLGRRSCPMNDDAYQGVVSSDHLTALLEVVAKHRRGPDGYLLTTHQTIGEHKGVPLALRDQARYGRYRPAYYVRVAYEYTGNLK